MDSAVWAFLGVLVGAGVTIVIEVIRGATDRKLDSAKRANDRWIEQQRFQFLTLLSLQDHVGAASNAAYAYLHDVLAMLEARGPDGNAAREALAVGSPAHAELDRRLQAIKTLASRVADDTLRPACRDLVMSIGYIAIAKTGDEAREAHKAWSEKARVVLETAGDLIRSMYMSRP